MNEFWNFLDFLCSVIGAIVVVCVAGVALVYAVVWTWDKVTEVLSDVYYAKQRRERKKWIEERDPVAWRVKIFATSEWRYVETEELLDDLRPPNGAFTPAKHFTSQDDGRSS